MSRFARFVSFSSVSRVLLLGVLCAAVAMPGCNARADICNDYVRAAEAMLQRCGITNVQVLTREDGSPLSCNEVVEVIDAQKLYDRCLPWMERVDCAELLDRIQTRAGLDSTCRNHFTYYAR